MLPRISSALAAKVTPLKADTTNAISASATLTATGSSLEQPPAPVLPFPQRNKEHSADREKSTPPEASDETKVPLEPAVQPPALSGVPARVATPLGTAFLELLEWIHKSIQPFSRVVGIDAYLLSLKRSSKGARFKKGALFDHHVE